MYFVVSMFAFFVIFQILIIVIQNSLSVSPRNDDPDICLSKLPDLIDSIISRYNDWSWGISLLTFEKEEGEYNGDGDGDEIYEKNSNKLYNPASNNKIYSSSSILYELGESYRFQTDIFEILLKNHSSSSACVMFKGNPDMKYEDLKLILEKIVNYSIVVLDFDSFFGIENDDFPVTWEYDDLVYGYGSKPIAGQLNINQDIVTFVSGENIGDNIKVESFKYSPIDIDFDVSHTVTVKEDICNDLSIKNKIGGKSIYVSGKMGINCKPKERDFALVDPREHIENTIRLFKSGVDVRRGKCDISNTLIYTHYSDVLVNLMNYTLQVSDNTFAELFLLQLGALKKEKDEDTAFSLGRQRIEKIMNEKFMVPSDSFRLNDGSGVSRQTTQTAKSLTLILKKMLQEKPIYRRLLPVAGRSGTLKNRFQEHKGILEAKTGTLTGVTCLSGYIHSKYFKEMIFSILVNNSKLSASEIQKFVDEIALYFAFTNPNC